MGILNNNFWRLDLPLPEPLSKLPIAGIRPIGKPLQEEDRLFLDHYRWLGEEALGQRMEAVRYLEDPRTPYFPRPVYGTVNVRPFQFPLFPFVPSPSPAPGRCFWSGCVQCCSKEFAE